MGHLSINFFVFFKMAIPLPDECFSNVLLFLDDHILYNCLLVNRYWCRFSVPILWRDPFKRKSFKSINALLACLNEDEISSLIPCAISFNNQTPLFDYGHFVRRLDRGCCIMSVGAWLNLSGEIVKLVNDCRIPKLVYAICHMIMRQGSNLQEFVNQDFFCCRYVDFPKFSVFTTYKPGITNLRSLNIYVGSEFMRDMVEFLNKVPNFCNGIIDCQLYDISVTYIEACLNLIKSQPLERVILSVEKTTVDNIEKIMNALVF